MNPDRIFGLAVCALALLFLVLAVPTIEQDDVAYYTVGSRFFPYIAGWLALVLGLLVAALPETTLPNLAALRGPAARQGIMRAGVLAVGYGAALPPLGFTLASVLALGLFLLAFGERRWLVIGPIALLAPPLVDVLFLELFRLRLPPGWFGLSVF